jgi:hypothetical protein
MICLLITFDDPWKNLVLTDVKLTSMQYPSDTKRNTMKSITQSNFDICDDGFLFSNLSANINHFCACAIFLNFQLLFTVSLTFLISNFSFAFKLLIAFFHFTLLIPQCPFQLTQLFKYLSQIIRFVEPRNYFFFAVNSLFCLSDYFFVVSKFLIHLLLWFEVWGEQNRK